jgi:hypothetical protein
MARTRRNRSRKNKNFIKRTFKTGINAAATTSKKYMPKVKTGLESVGSKVTKTATKSVPALQKVSRKLFSMLGIKKIIKK